ncbi:diguanylate cyclase [Pleomorphomonas carboxyditropha]|uniref:diguanylate cyclase n=1 Tax=Pleomorphomonas carboxyditropha TaxID=2023338 RepID=A0A2G9WNM0_9HYPH|nr:diguanylate cyclase [Pleomorphomonas carboxyditropha]PIO96309.1 hypothetical protein CJ014_26100 [Pleomorphomonas carboxyditropha]
MFDIQTLFSIIIFVSLASGSAIWIASATEPSSGLKELAQALVLHGLAYILYLASLAFGAVAVWLAEMSLGLFFVCGAKSLCLFHCVTFPRKGALLFLVCLAVSSAVYVDDIEARILSNSLFIMPMVAFALVVAVRNLPGTPGRGKYLVLSAIVLNLMLLVVRELSLSLKIGRIETFYDSDVSQSLIFLTSLFGLIFLAIGFVLMAKERTDHRNQELILRDDLTGAWNRRKLEEVAAMELGRLRRTGSLVSMLLIDLDNFKSINDRFGHVSGDSVLRRLAAACSGALRDIDVFGRWGGEEFLVLLPGAGVDEAIAAAERLRLTASRIEVEDAVSISVSIGISLAFSTDTVTSWFARADAALYRAKADGKNRWFIDTPLRREGGVLQLDWGESLRVGVDKVDEEHAELLAMANSLLKLLVGSPSKQAILHRLQILSETLIEHCASEEEVIAGRHPRMLEEHALSHAQMLDRLKFLTGLYEADDLPLNPFIQFIVFEICLQHMAEQDREVFAGAVTA